MIFRKTVQDLLTPQILYGIRGMKVHIIPEIVKSCSSLRSIDDKLHDGPFLQFFLMSPLSVVRRSEPGYIYSLLNKYIPLKTKSTAISRNCKQLAEKNDKKAEKTSQRD